MGVLEAALLSRLPSPGLQLSTLESIVWYLSHLQIESLQLILDFSILGTVPWFPTVEDKSLARPPSPRQPRSLSSLWIVWFWWERSALSHHEISVRTRSRIMTCPVPLFPFLPDLLSSTQWIIVLGFSFHCFLWTFHQWQTVCYLSKPILEVFNMSVLWVTCPLSLLWSWYLGPGPHHPGDSLCLSPLRLGQSSCVSMRNSAWEVDFLTYCMSKKIFI